MIETSTATQTKQLLTPEGRRIIAEIVKVTATEDGFITVDRQALTDEEMIRTLSKATSHSAEVEAVLDLLITRLNRNPLGNVISAFGFFNRTFDTLWSSFKGIREKLGYPITKFC